MDASDSSLGVPAQAVHDEGAAPPADKEEHVQPLDNAGPSSRPSPASTLPPDQEKLQETTASQNDIFSHETDAEGGDDHDSGSEDSGSDSDVDAFDFESCKKLGLKPDSFQEKRGVPTFKPTFEQFKDFGAFIKAVEPWGRRRGLVKVIPPPEWFEALGDPVTYVPPIAANFAIKTPINQHFQGTKGMYRQLNVEDRRARWSFRQFAEAALSKKNTPTCLETKKRRAAVDESLSDEEGDSDNEEEEKEESSDEDSDQFIENSSKKRSRAGKETKGNGGKRRRKVEDKDREEQQEGRQREVEMDMPEPSVANGVADDAEESLVEDIQEEERTAATSLPTPAQTPQHQPLPLPQPRTSASRTLGPLPQNLVDSFAKLDDELTSEVVPDLEREYWRSLGYGASPMYGADQLGSLFPKSFKHSWNLNNLENLLSETHVSLPGVTTPYIYAGMWKSTFAWHLEDVDLYSINYLHFGAPKHWYVIPPPLMARFDDLARNTFPADFKECKEFMRHKQYVLSPAFLQKNGIRPLKAVQRQGEFIITYPYGYHSGFNCGLNLAEAVNFATKSWIKLGEKAGYCRCISDSVKINMDVLLGRAPPPALEEKAPAKSMGMRQSLPASTDDTPAKKPRVTKPRKPQQFFVPAVHGRINALPGGPLHPVPPPTFYGYGYGHPYGMPPPPPPGYYPYPPPPHPHYYPPYPHHPYGFPPPPLPASTPAKESEKQESPSPTEPRPVLPPPHPYYYPPYPPYPHPYGLPPPPPRAPAPTKEGEIQESPIENRPALTTEHKPMFPPLPPWLMASPTSGFAPAPPGARPPPSSWWPAPPIPRPPPPLPFGSGLEGYRAPTSYGPASAPVLVPMSTAADQETKTE